MAFRDYLTGKTMAFLLPLAIYGCENTSNQCGNDMDCKGNYQVCSVTGVCIQEGTCLVDKDCEDPLVCEDSECVGYSVKSPKQVLSDFAGFLKENNLEKTLNQVHPESKTLRDALSGQSLPEELTGFNYGLSLPELGKQLSNINLTLKEEYGSYKDYTFPCGSDYECIFRFKKDENGQWKIERF